MPGWDVHHLAEPAKRGGQAVSKKLLAVASILGVAAVAAVANAQLSAYVEPVYQGYWPDETTYVYSYDLKVEVAGEDAWTVAGGPEVGDPWIVLTGGTFYQASMGGYTQPDPAILPEFPDLEYDTFYTTPLGWPNTEDQGESPGFAVGPIDNPTNLIADWFWTPDGYYYPGDFTIARFTAVAPPEADPATTYADIDVLVGSLAVPPFLFTDRIGIPEPASVALLALGALALLRRR